MVPSRRKKLIIKFLKFRIDETKLLVIKTKLGLPNKTNVCHDFRMKTYLQFLIIFIVVSLVNSPKESLADKNCPKNGNTIWTDCFGSKTSKTGDQYVGEWKKGVPQGKGTYAFPNGTKYSGEFHRGYRHGKGTYIFTNGDKYVGNFWHNKMDGNGTYSWADGTKFVGILRTFHTIKISTCAIKR